MRMNYDGTEFDENNFDVGIGDRGFMLIKRGVNNITLIFDGGGVTGYSGRWG